MTASLKWLFAMGAIGAATAAACGGDSDLVQGGPNSGGAGGTGGSTGGSGGSTGGSGGTGGDTGGTGGTGGDTGGSGGSTGGSGGTGGDTDGGTGGTGGATGGTGGTGGGGCPSPMTVRAADDITASTTWTACNTYVIPRQKQLFVKGGATLTIEPGTVVKGEEGSVLVITRGSKINAAGTKEKPIVFTSSQADGAKRGGWWGGVLILGAAPINTNKLSSPPSEEATFEAFTASLPEGKFGGTNAADDSGVLKYVRIEFAGFNFVSDREFNNLTFAGVGSGTTVDYVQVHAGSDDGVEFFGGTVNVKHIVSSQNEDDGFDTDNGWQGKAQFVIVQNVAPNGVTEAANGYESDNHGTAASYTAEPRTMPTVYNATLLGNKSYGASSFAAILRRGTGGKYYNHIFTGFPIGLEVRDSTTAEQITNGNLFIKNSVFFNNGADGSNWAPPQSTNDINEKMIFEDPSWNNKFTDPGIPAAAFNRTNPNFKPSAPITGGATPPSDGFFDASATFIGAIGADDWTTGWTAYPQPTQ
jgi:hypothetical protein